MTLSNMYGRAFLRKQLTTAKASSSVLIAILKMLLFVGMSLLEGIATGPVYIKKYSQQKNEVEISNLEGHQIRRRDIC